MFPRNRHFLKSVFAPIMGFPLVLFTVFLLWSNEGRAIKTARALAEGAKAVQHADNTALAKEHEGKLVHLSGAVTTESTVKDTEFNVEVPALRLRREVTMYQWKETESSNSNGSGRESTKTYSYSKVWSDKPISSASFHRSGHENPKHWRFESQEWIVPDAKMSAYRVPERIVTRLPGNNSVPAPLTTQNPAHGPVHAAPFPYAGGMFLGQDPNAPQVGDMCITFLKLNPGTFSIVSQQVGDTLQPYRAKSGVDVELVAGGNVDADAMFASAVSENTTKTWVLRVVGLVLLGLGMVLISNPISQIGARIPFLGSFVSAGVAMFAIGTAFIGWLVVISLAWLTYRPVLTFTLLLGAAALILWFARGRNAIASGGTHVKTA